MAGPFSAERQQQLGDAAKNFMEQFGKDYLKMYGLAMFERIKEDMDPAIDEKKLLYRDWKSIERPDVFTGECFMKSGQGAGSFGGWKKVFLVERMDYNLAVYPDKKTYDGGKKPKSVINMSGYMVEQDPTAHYRTEARILASGIGLSEEEVTKMASFSPYAWALTHPWRPNYVFQLHAEGGGGCACFGGSSVGPEDAGAEFEDKRNDYIRAFERCSAYGTPRDLDSITGKAFELTVGKMTSKFTNLSDFKDDGLESEILTDMLMQECLSPMRDEMLHDLVGPLSIKIALWYKTQNLVQKLLQGVSGPAWALTQQTAQALGEKIEPKVRQGVEPILRVKEDIKGKIRAKVTDKMASFLQQHVTPYIDPILKAFDKPMTQGFEFAKDVFNTKVEISLLPPDQKGRNLILDEIPRTYTNTSDISSSADALVEPIRVLKDLSQEIFADIDPMELRNMAEMSILETLDAAIFTLETRADENNGTATEEMKAQIITDFDHDVIVGRSDFVRDTVRTLLIIGFRKAIGPAVDPVIEEIDGQIPEDVQDFFSAAALFEEIVQFFVGEPIEKMVEGAYPRPQKKA